MCGLVAAGILAVLQQRKDTFRAAGGLQPASRKAFGDVLLHLSAQRGGQHLYAAAYPEDGQLAVECKADGSQFGLVALTVDGMKMNGRFLANPQRVDIPASCKKQAVNTFKRVDDYILVRQRRNDDRHAAGRNHRLIVTVRQTRLTVGKIARKSNHRLMLRLGKTRIDIVQTAFKVKGFHRYARLLTFSNPAARALPS